MSDTLIQKNAISEVFGNKALTLKDLTFSKRVFVYHETELNPSALSEITNILKTKNLIPEFRGPEYPFYEKHKQDSVYVKARIGVNPP